MPAQEKRNLIIGIVVVALAIIIALWLMLGQFFGWSTPPSKTTSGVVTNFPVSQLPDGFPSSTPLFSVIQTDQSFNVANSTSTEAGQKYVSSMQLLQIMNLYKQYFSQMGWTLSNFVLGNIAKTGASFSGTKGNESVLVRLTVDPKNIKETDVYVTYTLPK
jgi:hypothetical protein